MRVDLIDNMRWCVRGAMVSEVVEDLHGLDQPGAAGNEADRRGPFQWISSPAPVWDCCARR